MSNSNDEIRQLLKQITIPSGYDILRGTVKVVDEDKKTVDILLEEGVTVFEVKLRAAVNEENAGFVCIPKTGSFVVFAKVRGVADYVLIQTSELDKLIIETAVKVELNAPETLFNGGENDGMVLLHKLENNLQMLKDYLETMKNAVSNGLQAVGVGSAANGGTGSTAFNVSMSGAQLNFEDMENTKIKQ